MKHTAVFTAACDALAALLADPDRLNTDPQVVSEAMSHTAAAYLAAEGENRPAALDVPAPADPQVGAVLSKAWAALNAYTARELPAWGSAEHDALLIPLTHALTVLDVVNTVQEAATYAASPERHVRLAAQLCRPTAAPETSTPWVTCDGCGKPAALPSGVLSGNPQSYCPACLSHNVLYQSASDHLAQFLLPHLTTWGTYWGAAGLTAAELSEVCESLIEEWAAAGVAQ